MSQRLKEIDFIRFVLIFLLVFYHSFVIFLGRWEAPVAIEDNRLYWWMDSLAYSFMLECFVFISGYILGYQLIEKKIYENILGGVKKKLKRLMIPSIFFSCIYFLIFMDNESLVDTIFTILNGAGHLWFLPMLFWCFVFSFFLHPLRIKEKYKLLIALGVFSLQMIALPLRLNYAFSYFFYFYLGILSYKNRERIVINATKGNVVVIWITFSVVFVCCTLITEYLQNFSYNNLIIKALELELLYYMRLVYATVGTFAILFTALVFTAKQPLPILVKWLSPLCFGVYIYHQFILKYLYFQTQLPESVSATLLPWIGFIVALLTSIILSKLTLMTKPGRILIG